MAVRRGTPMRPRVTSTRRKRVWARQQSAALDVGTDGLAIDLATGFTAEMGTTHLPVGLTIGGIMLDFSVARVIAGTDAASSQLHFGVICVDEDVEGEVQRPLTDPHADWLWWQQISFPVVAVGTQVSTWDTAGGPLRMRARRKCEELGSHLWIVFQGYDIAPTFDIQFTSSVLMLLP